MVAVTSVNKLRKRIRPWDRYYRATVFPHRANTGCYAEMDLWLRCGYARMYNRWRSGLVSDIDWGNTQSPRPMREKSMSWRRRKVAPKEGSRS